MPPILGASSPLGATLDAGGPEASEEATLNNLQVSVSLSSPLNLWGWVADFVHNWRKLTSDAWVLQTVQGFHIKFYGSPVQSSCPSPLVFSNIQCSLIQEEISSLLCKGAITPVYLHLGGFLSNIFLVEKQDGGFRWFTATSGWSISISYGICCTQWIGWFTSI